MDKEYVERDTAIMTAMNYDGDGNAQDASQDIASALGDIPAADVRPVVRGEWIKGEYKWTCSNCGEDFSFYDNAFLHDGCYCPNCGADMREKNRCVTT